MKNRHGQRPAPGQESSRQEGFTLIEMMIAAGLSLVIFSTVSVAVVAVERDTNTVIARTADQNAAQAAVNGITRAAGTALGGTGMADVGVLAGGSQLWVYSSADQLSSPTGTSPIGSLTVGALTTGVTSGDSLRLVYTAATTLTSAIASGSVSALQVAALPGPVGAGQTVTVTSGGTSQTFTTSATALAAGATTIALSTTYSVSTSFPAGSTVVASTTQQVIAGASAAAGATSLALQTSYTPVVNFPAGTTLGDTTSWYSCTEWQIAASSLERATGTTSAATSSAMSASPYMQVRGVISGSSFSGFSNYPGLVDVTLLVQNATTATANGRQQATNASKLEAEVDDPNMPVAVTTTNPCP